MGDHREPPRPKHSHTWSVQRDKEFAAESALLLGYLVGAQYNIPCIHQDHASVHAIEVMVDGLCRDVMPPRVAAMIEPIAHIFFAAGQQYAMDGHVSSAHPSYEPEDDLSGPGQTRDEWLKVHDEVTAEWRKNIRDEFYVSKKKTLGDLLAHLAEHHGDELNINVTEIPEGELLSRLLGPQRTAPEPENDNRAGPYL